jgi:serine/threonine protein kinase/Tol biopolymer transport system component
MAATAAGRAGSLAAGSRLGRYLIVEPLGAGGMGVVYRARDEKLERAVAIKMLAQGLLTGEEARRHFHREARALAKLNHPRIAAVYDVGEQDGADYIVMELVEGQSLAAKLKKGALPVKDATAIALQVAEALKEAHERGVIHRDLKPANVMITPKGDAKVLDFGLAKMLAPPDGDATMSLAQTQGLLGTPLYMSPEQALGYSLDARTDLWSLGALYYESLAGQPPFKGNNQIAILHAITSQPVADLGDIRPKLPPLAEHILARALEKDPELRYQRAADVETDLRRLTREFSDPRSTMPYTGAVTRKWSRRRAWWLAAGVAAAVAGVAAAILLTPKRVTELLDSKQITSSSEPKLAPLLTDGTRVYFQIRNVPSEMAASGGIIAPMPGLSQGMILVDVSADGSKALVFTPDVNDETGRGWLWAGSTVGGPMRKLGDHLSFQAARWAPDGKSIFFADSHSLDVMDEHGGNVQTLWTPPNDPRELSISPNGKEISVTLLSPAGFRLWQVGSDGSNPHPLLLKNWPEDSDESNGQWTPDGRHFTFHSGIEGRGNVYEVIPPPWFEPWTKPEAVRITGNQVDIQDSTPAPDSKALFVLGRLDQGTTLALDPRSKTLTPFLNGISALEFVVSPDRQWMAYTEYPSGHLWKSRVDGSDALQLTDAPAYMEQWSPDAKWIVYSDWHKLYRVLADGGSPEKLIESGDDEVMPTWFPDGQSIAFNRYDPSREPDGMFVLDVATRKVTPMAGAEKYYVAQWSPDGKYMAAVAREPSRMMLYTAATRQWRELRRFDAQWGYYAWSLDSRSIYFGQTQEKVGMYRLSVPGGAWEKVASMENVDASEVDGFVSVTANGQPAIMSHSGAAQVYLLAWK